MTPRRIVAFLATFLLVPVLVLLPSGHAAPQSVAPAETQAPGEIRVAAANVFEGSLVRYRADRRNGTDRQAFANRLLGQAAAMPDVVLVQEALGTDGLIAAALNAHPRSAQTGTRFVQLGTTSHGFGTGTCDGWRPGRFSVLRSSAILVNARTVTAVNDQGVLRTWGRWHKRAWKHTGRKGHGCTEHPWARITVTHPETAARTALVTSVHLAPKGLRMKNRALRVTGTHLDALHRHVPGDAVVLAGDLNITRCQHPPLRGEKATCAIRPGHRALLDSGYRDAVHSQNFTGPTGVVGVANRIDFLYTKGEVTASWHDRCYRAHFVRQWRCDASQAVFASPTRFRRCEARHLFHGRPGNGCPPTMFRRYYSDHPVLATVLR